MASKRKAKKKSTLREEEFLKPIDITQFGSDNDPCFGKLYNLAEPECKRCGDQSLCGIVFGQTLHLERNNVEAKSKFKDLELDKLDKPKTTENKALEKWVKNKISEGLTRVQIIKKAKATFGSTRDEIKEIYKKLK